MKNIVVVVAHPGDFVWRSSGALLLHKQRGYNTHVICLSPGIRGEAGSLWNQDDADDQFVSSKRKEEAQLAADIIGANIKFFDLEDCPLMISKEIIFEISKIFRSIQPEIIITHPFFDPNNVDHANVCSIVMQARTVASAPGYGADTTAFNSVYHFEPHQPELCNYQANILLDITNVWDKKWEAFLQIQSQQHTWDYYKRVALLRGSQASRRNFKKIIYAEAYQIHGQIVLDKLC